jgi:UDP-N-acetylglucosamine acyltransferase
MIHPTAIVHLKAQLDPSVEVGPYCVVDAGVRLGAGCKLGPHVYLTGQTEIGPGNQFFAGCVIGEAPQDLKYDGRPTRLVIGSNNVFREHVTVHRSTTANGQTVIGSNNYLMANAHVGHNSSVGDHVIIANGALLGGHVTIFDRAFISGNCCIHQYTRVGTLVIMRGGSGVSMDLPPYTVALGDNAICGLNTVGLRRAGLSAEQRLELKRLYRALFRSGVNMNQALASARREFTSEPSQVMIEFIASAKRGVCPDTGKTFAAAEEESE